MLLKIGYSKRVYCRLISCLVSFVLISMVLVPNTVFTMQVEAAEYNDILSDNYFYDSDYYNKDLANACAELCLNVDNIAPFFPDGQSEQYSWERDSEVFKVGIGYKTVRVDNEPRNLVLIDCKGTSCAFEIIADLFSTLHAESFENQKAYLAPRNYERDIESYLSKFETSHPGVHNNPCLFLVTGHSLGGAAANLLGARLSNRYGSENVFVYTFGAIKAIDSSSNVQDGYPNIFNIYNYHDTFGPNGGNAILGVSDPNYKFGYTFMCDFKFGESSPWALDNHDMGHYRDAVSINGVDVTTGKLAGSLDSSQRWRIDGNSLEILGTGDMGEATPPWRIPSFSAIAAKINDIYIEDGITSIGWSAFSNLQNLEIVHIPTSVTSIGNYAFWGCGNLSHIYYMGTQAQWDAIKVDYGYGNGDLRGATLHAKGDEVETIASGECGYYGDNVMYELNDRGTLTIYGEGDMDDYSFGHSLFSQYSSDIKRIVVDNGVTRIGDYAFHRCRNVTDVTMFRGVESIGASAFDSCDKLKWMMIPSSVETIELYAVSFCPELKDIYYGGGESEWARINNSEFNTEFNYMKIHYYKSYGPNYNEYREDLGYGDYNWIFCRQLDKSTMWIEISFYRLTGTKIILVFYDPYEDSYWFYDNRLSGTVRITGEKLILDLDEVEEYYFETDLSDFVNGLHHEFKLVKSPSTVGKTVIRNTIANTVANPKYKDVIYDAVPGATGYDIAYKHKNSSKWVIKSVGKTARARISGFSINGLYEIKVRAKKAETATHSAAIGTWSPTIYRYFYTTKKIRLKSASKGSFTMSWARDSRATSYQVMFTTNKNGAGAAKNINTVGKNATSFTKKGLKSGQTYYVQVRTLKKVGSNTYVGNISNPVPVKIK